MDRARFYSSLRARGSGVFGTSLSQRQVNGIEAILNEAEKRGTSRAHLAYMLATTYHETAHTMQPVEEYGRGKGRKYGVPAGPYGKVYFGRGFVQLTWLANYNKASSKLGVDLVKFPERALELRIATLIMFDGMAEGWFTGQKLSDYDGFPYDYINARGIINGTDKDELIAGYAKAFESALMAGGYTRQIARPADFDRRLREVLAEKAASAPKADRAPKPAPKPQSEPAINSGRATGVLGFLIFLTFAAGAMVVNLLMKGN